ncbi:MAG: glycogen/starch synthase, partial [Planctomycetota bacterium]
MRVFMLGWEFPPFISGGLGTACYGLTKAMDQLGMEVIFVLPTMVESEYATHVKLLSPASRMPAGALKYHELKNVVFRTISSPLQPYSNSEVYQRRLDETLRQKRMAGGNVSSASQLIGGADYSGDMIG